MNDDPRHEPRRRPRSGSEPLTARTDLPLRLLLSLIFVPLFTLLTIGFVIWWASSGAGDSPSRDELLLLAIGCCVLTVISWIDLWVVRRRLRQARRPHVR